MQNYNYNYNYNYNKNFKKFLENITLTPYDDQSLRESRKKIRSSIRVGFNEKKDKYFSYSESKVLQAFIKDVNKPIKPRFMTQGSYAYKTINRPCQPPKQQMDLDDGVYLPLSYVEGRTNGNFNRAAQIVRGLVYDIVNDVCNENKWILTRHPKCLRIQISHYAHIDLPIYSIPDRELETIKDSARMQNYSHATISFDSLYDSTYKDINVLLATDYGWQKSDPRKIYNWVRDSSKQHTRFKKYSRIIKSWRDYKWSESKFSSIMIMAGIEQAMSKDVATNDNIALDLYRKVNYIISDIEGDGILDPDTKKRLDKRLGHNKQATLEGLRKLAANLNESTRESATDLLIDCFGDRFPKRNPIRNAMLGVANSIPIYAEPIKQYREDKRFIK